MAYLAASAIQTRVREVLQEGAGALRSITAGTYLGDFPEGETDMDAARAVVVKARVEARCLSTRRSKASPPLYSNLALYEQTWRVRVQRIVERLAQVDDDVRDAAKALAFQDVDVITQALSMPGNLTATAAGTSTGIVSGLFTHIESTSDVRGPVDDGASIIETDHLFTCVVRSAPATS